MTATACTLAVLLTFEAASAPAAKKEECELTDDRCKAALYERRSMTVANANHRAQYLFNAHNLYLRLFDKTQPKTQRRRDPKGPRLRFHRPPWGGTHHCGTMRIDLADSSNVGLSSLNSSGEDS